MGSIHQVVTSIRDRVEHFCQSTFSSVVVQGPKLDVAFYQQCPLMFTCTHRGHIDYILVGHNLHLMGFQDMRFAAGDNLTRLPYIGPRFKSWGAFTVARDSGFERNYVRNLCNGVISMLDKREPIVVFPEGGRSYSGAMLDLKVGILGAAILAQARDLTKDVYIVPMAVSYECLPDLPFFEMLQRGKKLRKRTNNFLFRIFGSILYFGADVFAYVPLISRAFMPVVSVLKRSKKFGTAFLDYKTPVSVRSLIDIAKNKNESARDEFSAHRDSMQKLSEYLQKEFYSLYRLLPSHILSYIIRNGPLSIREAEAKVSAVIDMCKNGNRNVSYVQSFDSSMIVSKGIELLKRYKAIKVKNGCIQIRKMDIIRYYSAAVVVGG